MCIKPPLHQLRHPRSSFVILYGIFHDINSCNELRYESHLHAMAALHAIGSDVKHQSVFHSRYFDYCRSVRIEAFKFV